MFLLMEHACSSRRDGSRMQVDKKNSKAIVDESPNSVHCTKRYDLAIYRHAHLCPDVFIIGLSQIMYMLQEYITHTILQLHDFFSL